MRKRVRLAAFLLAATVCGTGLVFNGSEVQARVPDDTIVMHSLNASGRPGDYNSNETVDVFDVIRFKKDILNQNKHEHLYRQDDIDQNGKIDEEDLNLVKGHVLMNKRLWFYYDLPPIESMPYAVSLESALNTELFHLDMYEGRVLADIHSMSSLISKRNRLEDDMNSIFQDFITYTGNNVMFSAPLTDEQKNAAESAGVSLKSVPVAKEGLVFYVNKNNPVNSLSSQQLKDIYSGKITNWSEVGGQDERIVPFQTETEYGSQYYMEKFMNGTELTDPPTILGNKEQANGTANYDNSSGAIGYSVYSSAGQLFKDSDTVKIIAVDDVAPSVESISDASYPLTSELDVVYRQSAGEKVMNFIKFITSDEGQEYVLSGGFIPVKNPELPDNMQKLYSSKGTGKPKPENSSPSLYYSYYTDYSRSNGDDSTEYSIGFLKDKGFQDIVNKDISSVLSTINNKCSVDVKIINGYMSVVIYTESDSTGNGPVYYTDEIVTLNYDLTGKKKIDKFSDLFYKDSDFMPFVNRATGESISLAAPTLWTDYYGVTGDVSKFTVSSAGIDTGNPYIYGNVLIPFSKSIKEYYETCVVSEYYDVTTLLDDRYSASEINNTQWYYETPAYPDKELPVINSAFHTDDEINAMRKACDHANEILADMKKNKKDGPYSYLSGHLNWFVHPMTSGDHYAVINALYFNHTYFDRNTGERLRVSDIFGDQFKQYDDSIVINIGWSDSFDKIDEVTLGNGVTINIDKDTLNPDYILPINSKVKMYDLDAPLKGEAHGEKYSLNGYPDSYVIDYGPEEDLWPIEGDWHITAKRKCYSHGKVWFDCYDTDDGDHYGWIDSGYIDFY